MPPYATRLKNHLVEYRNSKLGVAEHGLWSRNKKAYPHILPKAPFALNILEPMRDSFWAYADRSGLKNKLHRDFRHLTSSQALAFNLFFPFLQESLGESASVLAALRIPEKTVAAAEFEAVPNSIEKTNCDFFATFTDDTRLLVEVKLSETGFGEGKDAESRKAKLADHYRKHLQGKAKPTVLEEANFFANYQLFRNLSYVGLGDSLVLLVPRANSRTFAQGEQFIDTMITEEFRSAVRLVALEDFLAGVRARSQSGAMLEVVELLNEKYVIA